MASPEPVEPAADRFTLVQGEAFAGWHALNDTIMGGRSRGSCRVDAGGLVFDAEVVVEGGGFVSLRSPQLSPPLDLSRWGGLELDLRGDGRTYKLAVACADGMAGLTELIPGGLRWVAAFATADTGLTRVRIGFDQLTPSLRAKPIDSLPLGVPLRFDPARITRLQLLHSRFGDDGQPNPGFRPGPLHLDLLAIHAVP
ncbi:MAG: CIA30 family protein [Cyanobacteriota bacterium]|nr:CIA30 family protein [Cyanobacteriota bacterium]